MTLRAAAALLAVAACHDHGARAVAPPAAAAPAASPAALPGSSATATPPVSPLAGARQLIAGVVDDWGSTTATLRMWRRGDGAWHPVGDAWPAVVGRAGTAWGDGLHGAGATAGREGPRKREGDGRSPAGAFSLRAAYGYADEPPAGTRLPYAASGRGELECVDDPASRHYTRIVDRARTAADWQSSERMRRDDALYTWVVDVAHNPAARPGGGSCIFLHVWSAPGATTVGCTAMDQARLAAVLANLDPAANPVFVLLPRADYLALEPAWDLPPPPALPAR